MDTASRALVIPVPNQLPRRPAVGPRRSLRTTEAYVAMVEAGGFVGWALHVSEGEGATSCCSASGGSTTLASAGSATGLPGDVVGRILDHLAERVCGRPVALFSAAPAVVHAAGGRPGMDAYPTSMARTHPRRSEVTLLAREELGNALREAPRLVAAVDGSWGRGSRTAGWAFVTEQGHHDSSSRCQALGSTEAELRAIGLLLASVPANRRVAILTDSRPALAALAQPARVEREARAVVHGLLGLLEDRDVQFRWVKGHSGPGLHDAADRLAVAARRAREGQLGESALPSIASRIVAEGLAAHAQAPRSQQDLDRAAQGHADGGAPRGWVPLPGVAGSTVAPVSPSTEVPASRSTEVPAEASDLRGGQHAVELAA